MSIEPLEPLESIESIEPIESSNVEQIYTVFLTINNDNFIKQNDKYFVIEPIYIQYIGFFFCVEILHFLNTNTNINFLVEHQNFYFDIINGKDNGGRTCLMLASTQGDLDIVEFLLVYGANINESDNSGQTCLMCACDKGDIKMVQLLLDNGANINDKDIYGANCLMYALKSEYYMNDITLNITKLLLSKGVNIHETNAFGETCFSHAEFMRLNSVLYLIRKWPAYMFAIVLEELGLEGVMDNDSICDFFQYFGKEDFTLDNEEDYAKDSDGDVINFVYESDSDDE